MTGWIEIELRRPRLVFFRLAALQSPEGVDEQVTREQDVQASEPDVLAGVRLHGAPDEAPVSPAAGAVPHRRTSQRLHTNLFKKIRPSSGKRI